MNAMETWEQARIELLGSAATADVMRSEKLASNPGLLIYYH